MHNLFNLSVIATCFFGTGISATANADDFTPVNTQAAGEEPLPPAEAIKRLRVPEGFRITLAAAEPDVRQPIAMTFDDRGRLWVAESYSYDGSTFTDETRDRILIFEDTTGDGVLDRRRVFCDGLTHLTGLEIGFGGVWITAPPNLSFIPDRNHDDVPDGDTVVHLDGWSLKAEHNSVNGLTWGPDGWLYGRHGIKQSSHVGRPGDSATARVELSCCIWRYHPTRHVFEVVADGTINPWGLDFDDHGQGFLTTSVVEHLWHLVPGAHYERWKNRGVHPNPYVYETMSATSDHLHWASSGSWDKAGRQADGNQDFGGGHSHCDAMIYLGDRWPQRFRGALLTSNIHGRRANSDRLFRDAGPFRGEHGDDFLVADDPWFRAVSMEYGPDGDVYLTDWSDNGECHDRDGVHRTSGRIYKITWGDPTRVNVDLQAASTKQLVDYQLHANDWFVRHARRILQERSVAGQDLSAAHTELRRQLETNPDVTRKLRALWTLHSTGGLGHDRLIELLGHASEHMRSWAVRLLVDGQQPGEAAINRFAELAKSEQTWLVRLTLASAAQRLPAGRRWEVATSLAANAAGATDLNLQRMLWYAMEPEVATDPERAMKFAEMASSQMRRWLARRVTEDSARSVEYLFAKLERTTDGEVIADLLRGFNDGLLSVKLTDVTDSSSRIAEKLLEHADARVRVEAVSAAAAIGNEAALTRIRRLLHDTATDTATREAALSGLVRRKAPGLVDDLQQLIATGQLTTPVLQAGAAIDDPAFARTVLGRYSEFARGDRGAVVDLLVARKESARLLVTAIEQKKIAAADISAEQARQIAALGDAELLKRLDKVWGTVRRSSADRLRQIQLLVRTLDPSRIGEANLTHGRELFQKTCATCHKLFGDGRTIGPELTGANRRNLHYLVSNVVDPSAAVPADFRMATVVTTNGRVITGAISQRSEAGLTILTATESIQIGADDVDMVKVSSQSMMPDGLLDKLNEDQTRDLFAWLMSDGAVSGAALHSRPDSLPVVILLGDSIRMNYQQTVVAELKGKATVWAPRENCKHTAFVLEQLEKWVKGRNASVVHINVGLHDMFLDAKSGQPRHSLDVYSKNLRAIFAKLKTLTDARIVFALTTPVDEGRQAASETYGRVVRHEANVVRYNARAAQVARQAGIQINDLQAVTLKAGPKTILRESDGIHLSKFGEETIGRHVAKVIERTLSDTLKE
ncbi:MAG: c-type cytochrome [Rhodopirellula sp.]|nr:c-type cytochrome [Rhodopirellula sp.]